MNLANIRTKTKIFGGFTLPLILTLILGSIAIYSISSMTFTNKWVEHTHNVLEKSTAIISSGVNMETGMRGYLLAGKEEFLDPYKGGEKQTYKGISELQQTVNDNPKQVARLQEVEKILKGWQQNVTEPTIQLRRKIGDAKTMNDMAALVGEARGKTYFDKFRGQIATFIEREASLLTRRRAAFKAAKNEIGALAKQGDNAGIQGKLAVMAENEEWVEHTYKVIAKANDILAAAVDMETGMRGYLLAGQEGFLDPYKGGQKRFKALVDEL